MNYEVKEQQIQETIALNDAFVIEVYNKKQGENKHNVKYSLKKWSLGNDWGIVSQKQSEDSQIAQYSRFDLRVMMGFVVFKRVVNVTVYIFIIKIRMSSPVKRELSTRLKNSSSARAHNLTFYKKEVEEFKPDGGLPMLPMYTHERKATEGTILMNQQILRQRTIEELEKKVQIVLRHNSHLLAENASLGELLAERSAEIQTLVEKLEAQMRGQEKSMIWVEVEKKRLLQDFERRQAEHNDQIRKLLDEISKLHDQCYEVENIKNQEIQRLKAVCQKQTYSQIQNLKRSQNGNIEIFEAQIRALKETLEQKNFQTESEHHQSKLILDKQAEELKHLQSQIKHLNKIRTLELDECRVHYENEMHTKMRETERKQELEHGNTEAALRKLKKELADKTLDVERFSNKLGAATKDSEAELHILKIEKDQLKEQVDRADAAHRETLRVEREKMKKMTELEIQNLENANTNYTNSLKSEVQKLYELSQCKTSQIKTLFDQLQNLRDANRKETDYLTNLNNELKKQLLQLQLKNVEELELLKIKMAELHQGDISSLRVYYENQLRVQAEQILALERQLNECRAKIHKELQEKNEMRKEFEMELAKEKAKNSDLRVKLAALSVEMKEQLTSMTSKMELTSQTLLREADLKQKGQAFHDEEKRKLHHLINGKDMEISDLTQQMDRAKKGHENDAKSLREQIAQLREFNKELEGNLQKERDFSEAESKKREAKAREEIDSLSKVLQNLKNVDHAEMKSLIDKLQKENIKLQKDLQNAERDHKNVMVELGIRNGFVETMQLESCAAIEQERTKVKVLMNKNEMSMKNYYEDKIANREKQIKALKEQLIQKQVDIRDLITRYNELQKKLASLLESQEKLRDFENRVMHLGMDNNLVKNMAELFRSRA